MFCPPVRFSRHMPGRNDIDAGLVGCCPDIVHTGFHVFSAVFFNQRPQTFLFILRRMDFSGNYDAFIQRCEFGGLYGRVPHRRSCQE